MRAIHLPIYPDHIPNLPCPSFNQLCGSVDAADEYHNSHNSHTWAVKGVTMIPMELHVRFMQIYNPEVWNQSYSL